MKTHPNWHKVPELIVAKVGLSTWLEDSWRKEGKAPKGWYAGDGKLAGEIIGDLFPDSRKYMDEHDISLKQAAWRGKAGLPEIFPAGGGEIDYFRDVQFKSLIEEVWDSIMNNKTKTSLDFAAAHHKRILAREGNKFGVYIRWNPCNPRWAYVGHCKDQTLYRRNKGHLNADSFIYEFLSTDPGGAYSLEQIILDELSRYFGVRITGQMTFPVGVDAMKFIFELTQRLSIRTFFNRVKVTDDIKLHEKIEIKLPIYWLKSVPEKIVRIRKPTGATK